MLISLEWLDEYIDILDLDSDSICDLLTQLGHEVETVQSIPALSERIVVGEILKTEKHPQADKLNLCEVKWSLTEPPASVVCGADNLRKGLKVVFAQIASVLPDGFKLKESKIRGVLSQGMCCSEKELGFSDEHDEIIELPDYLEIGKTIESYCPRADTILELSITPNRGDCLSYLGIARELAAKLGRPLRKAKFAKKPSTSEEQAVDFKVEVEESVGCHRFVARKLSYTDKKTNSPLWLKKRLNAAGMRPISLLVDISNYVMLETGQPNHAYDSQLLAGKTLKVRKATDKESLTLLDGQKVSLQSEDILIADADKAVGIAGVIGGQDTEVGSGTKEILLEVAHFLPNLIRKTAKRLALNTEASYRFERGIDLAQLPWVADRFESLLQQTLKEQGVEQTEALSSTVDFFPNPPKPRLVALRLERCQKVLGDKALTLEICQSLLSSLGCSLEDNTDERMLFSIPSFRLDIEREIDLIEEVARLRGFSVIPYEIPAMNIEPNKEHDFISFSEKVKLSLAKQGLVEVVTFPFVSGKQMEKMGLSSKHCLYPSVELQNPLSEELSFLQTTLVPNLLSSLLHNRNRGYKGSHLFEVSHAYSQAKSEHNNDSSFAWLKKSECFVGDAYQKEERILEYPLCSFILDHPFLSQAWSASETALSFYHGKKVIEDLLSAFSQISLSWQTITADAYPWLHPGRSARLLVDGRELAWVGELHPQMVMDHGLGLDAIIAGEIALELLFAVLSGNKKQAIACELKRFPPVTRDLAFLLDRSLTYADLAKAIEDFPQKKHCKSFKLFDVYEGEGVSDSKKSMAMSFSFEAQDKTLTDKEVEKEISALLSWLSKSHGVKLR